MAPQPTAKPVVEFYFDTSCPWSYLALERLREAAIRTGARVDFRPVLVADVLEAANPGFPPDRTEAVPARARYQAKDLNDWARYCGLALRRPRHWPLRPAWAQRGAVAAAATGGEPAVRRYLEAVFPALFAEGRDIGDRAIVEAIAVATGLDATRFGAALQEGHADRVLADNAARLVAAGGFGTPSFLVDPDGAGDLYFGNDRLPLVEAALARAGGLRLVLPGAHGA